MDVWSSYGSDFYRHQASYKLNLVIPVEAYLLLIVVFFFSVTLFIMGCVVKRR